MLWASNILGEGLISEAQRKQGLSQVVSLDFPVFSACKKLMKPKEMSFWENCRKRKRQ